MKRRVFLSSIISVLVGIPVGVHLFQGKRQGGKEGHLFSKELKKYRSLTDVVPARADDIGTVPYKIDIPVKRNWRYVIFAPSYLPNEYSLATGNDPDVFALRDGRLFIDRNNSDQTFIYGGDSVFKLYSPTVIDDRHVHEVSLLAKENGIVPARTKGVKPVHQRDWHFYHLLTLKDFPYQELKPGMKWTSKQGRIRPFGGFTTHYEVAGFSRIGDRNTVDIAFSGKIPNLVGMRGLNDRKPNPGDAMSNEHKGHAWFDLETGLLARQEVEMETSCSSNVPRRGRRRDNNRQQSEETTRSMLVKSHYITQLFFG